MKQGHGAAHGKIILMGEHSVVYGLPAVAIPFPSTQINVTVTENNEQMRLECDFYSGLLTEMPELLESLHKTIALSLNHFEKEPHLTIRIASTIPAERGMGSSAAVAVATTRAIFDYYDTYLSQEKLLAIVNEAEKIAHGNPSGLDALMTSSDTPYFFVKNKFCEPFSFNLTGVLIVADTGITGQTKEAVVDVARKSHLPQIKQAIKTLGSLANQSRQAIESNQATTLGQLMTHAHQNLKKIGVSNEVLDKLVETALSTKALGAKLTGGGRGGCMIALAKNIEHAQLISHALKENGAKQTWLYQIGDTHV